MIKKLCHLIFYLSVITSCQSNKALLDNSKNWQGSNYGVQHPIEIDKQILNIPIGDPINGVHWIGDDLRKSNYSLEFDARRTQGNDFFVGLTFPIKNEYCSLILGGWANYVSGLSSINGLDASENESTSHDFEFKNNTWYQVELIVMDDFIQCHINQQEVFKVKTKDKTFSIRPEVEPSKPLGFCTFYSSAEYRNIVYTSL